MVKVKQLIQELLECDPEAEIYLGASVGCCGEHWYWEDEIYIEDYGDKVMLDVGLPDELKDHVRSCSTLGRLEQFLYCKDLKETLEASNDKNIELVEDLFNLDDLEEKE